MILHSKTKEGDSGRNGRKNRADTGGTDFCSRVCVGDELRMRLQTLYFPINAHKL